VTPERIAGLVRRWARAYTRGVPPAVARRRAEELDADLHDHIAHERARGTGERRIALGVLSRMVRGAAADVAWRRRHAVPSAGRSVRRVACATAAILLLPAAATLAGGGAAWGPLDFLLAAVLLMGAGLALELAVSRRGRAAYRAAAGLALAGALLMVWLVVAVGVLGETGDPADAMYGGVLAVLAAGALVARLRPGGMATALLAAALAQAAVAAVALATGAGDGPAAKVIGVNAIFVALFLAAAALFRRAAGPPPAPAPRR
jgi:hypothetical protein